MSHFARLAAALSHSLPDVALREALDVARELGIVSTESGQEPWLTLTHKERTLRLSTLGEMPADAAAWAHLLQAGFARAVEHEHFLRVRERAELLSAASFEGLIVHVNGEAIDANQRLCQMLGFELPELLAEQPFRRCIAPEDLQLTLERFASGFEGAYVITLIRKDGSRFRAELQATQGKLGDRPVRVAAIRDVTERELAQSLLRESELRLRMLAETAFDLTMFSRDGVVVDSVGKIEGMLGYTREEVIGRTVRDLVAESARPQVAEVQSTRRTGAFETRMLARSGEEIPVEVVALSSTLHGEPVRMGAIRDLRELKRQERERRALESAFEQSQRLESLGVLAGGIAHDFNNLLTVVLGHADLLHRRLGGTPERELVRGIADAAQRAAGLTSQMLAYAGRGELGPREPVDLGGLVQELRSLLAAALSKKASIAVSLATDTWVLGNRSTLTQVIMNLLTNASDALAGQPGTIHVRSSFLEQPGPHWVRALGNQVKEGRWVLLEVSDTGAGMDEATQTRIFEPFFTTKPQGHGLGLAACLGIVSSHGGAILVESQVGCGSTFSVLLPAHAEGQRTPVEKRRSAPVGARTVLVVDDEPSVRAHLCHALRLQGYEVAEAGSGRLTLEALEHCEPSVILLDVTMPDLSGVDVLRRIRARGLRVPVVLSSGYHDAVLDDDESSYQGFLTKPYTLDELFEKLERALAFRADPPVDDV